MKYIIILLTILCIGCKERNTIEYKPQPIFERGEVVYIDNTKFIISTMEDYYEVKNNNIYYWVILVDKKDDWRLNAFQVVETNLITK